MTETQTSAAPRAIPPALYALSVFYGGMVCIAGVLANKQVALGPLAVEAGIFAFLMLVVTSSAVTELYGVKAGRKLVFLGFVPLLISSALTYSFSRFHRPLKWMASALRPIIFSSPRPRASGLAGSWLTEFRPCSTCGSSIG